MMGFYKRVDRKENVVFLLRGYHEHEHGMFCRSFFFVGGLEWSLGVGLMEGRGEWQSKFYVACLNDGDASRKGFEVLFFY